MATQQQTAQGELMKMLPRPPTFSGNHEDWNEWRFVFTSWAYAGLPHAEAMMGLSENANGAISVPSLRKYVAGELKDQAAIAKELTKSKEGTPPKTPRGPANPQGVPPKKN